MLSLGRMVYKLLHQNYKVEVFLLVTSAAIGAFIGGFLYEWNIISPFLIMLRSPYSILLFGMI